MVFSRYFGSLLARLAPDRRRADVADNAFGSEVLKMNEPTAVNKQESSNKLPEEMGVVDAMPMPPLSRVQVIQLVEVARKSPRHGNRDAALLWFFHCYPVPTSVMLKLRWDAVNFIERQIVFRNKNEARQFVFFLGDYEVMLLEHLQGQYLSEYVFPSRRGTPLSVGMVPKIIDRYVGLAGFSFRANLTMLRHEQGNCPVS